MELLPFKSAAKSLLDPQTGRAMFKVLWQVLSTRDFKSRVSMLDPFHRAARRRFISSAALEVATATLLETILGQTLDPVQKALLCQKAEHDLPACPAELWISSSVRCAPQTI